MAQTFKRPPSGLDHTQFVALYGRVYEHSPWIAESAWSLGLTPQHDTVEGLHETLAAIVDAAPQARQLALLNAHPDLAGRLAVRRELTAESTSEQASAGLDKCSPDEFRRFTALNEAYRAKFPFPFIMAVKGRSRSEILDAFEQRIHNSADVEFRTALAEVHKIALLRLREL
ncbi:MAG: 2-oxo-4-hydroxy-4-carboxy-5-ureidoimidazoline decarboxylase [Rhodospirillaceae bacterium]|nr:2-oxo-4-hydroxy-4-carboxy-5-ureidoimidazoline decarboxylase [Rhodospirillaceae bacterium]